MTKINARSPYFLSYAEPTVPSPEFTCDVAKDASFSLTISQRGEISYTELSYGTIALISSSDSDFANGKFPDETVPTSRTVVLKIAIPTGFSNSSDNFLNCSITEQQPAYVSGTTCTANTTLNGTIANQSLVTNGTTTVALDLSTKFTAGSSAITGYRIVNEYESLISVTAVTSTGGSSQSIQFTTQNNCGVGYVQIYAIDALNNSCDVFQQAQITVTGCSTNFTCTDMNLQGGAVAQGGVITMPTGTQLIPATGSVSVNSDGSSPIAGSQPFSTTANSGGAAQSVTLYFKTTIPSGYNNSGDLWCSKVFTQQAASTLPAFACATANHTDYTISSRGSINKGQVQLGTIKSFSPIGFDEVSADTPQTVTFTITSPNESTVYSNPNVDITCAVTIQQPAYTAACGTNNIYLSTGFADGTGGCLIDSVCLNTFPTTTYCTSTSSFASLTLGDRVCLMGLQSFRGSSLWYGVNSFSGGNVGLNAGLVKFIKLDSYGLIQSIALLNCDGGCDQGGIL